MSCCTLPKININGRDLHFKLEQGKNDIVLVATDENGNRLPQGDILVLEPEGL